MSTPVPPMQPALSGPLADAPISARGRRLIGMLQLITGRGLSHAATAFAAVSTASADCATGAL